MISKLSDGVLFFLLIAMLGCGSWPPVRITTDESTAYVDVRNLGEYGTSISRISLIDLSSSKVIWEVVNSEAPQMPGFRVVAGGNSVLPNNLDKFGFAVVIPSKGNHFEIGRGTDYLLKVWDHERVSSSTFSFPILPQEKQSRKAVENGAKLTSSQSPPW